MSQFLADWLPVITVLIALAALLVAIWAQLRTQETQRDLQRPILILDEGSIVLYQLDNGAIDWDKSFHPPNPDGVYFRLGLINVGAGVATRIEGVFFGPDDPIFEAADRRLTLLGYRNLAPGETATFQASPGRTLVYGSSRIGPRWRWFRKTYTLQAPRAPTPAQRSRLDMPRVVARLTLTYHDVYGRVHASVFDYTEQRVWRAEAFLQNIAQDIDTLDRRDRQKRVP